MAVDEALLESVAAGRCPPLLRLYRWQPAAVSLGYAQRGTDQVNLTACRRQGVEVVRRITGGRAVLHQHELTYAVVAPEQGGVFSGGVLENYRVIAAPLLALFARLGIDGRLVSGRSRFHGAQADGASSVCFSVPSSYEILCAGRKLTGGAQKRQGGAFLQHGSIPLDLDLERLWDLLNPEDAKPRSVALRHLEQSVGWINRWHHPPLNIDSLETLFVESFAAVLGLTLEDSDLSPVELARAQELVATRYGCESWNLRGLT
ncbi:lipoate-protein ligase A [Geoalkalibacter ferrihydriticus]|nr:lipoate-protein ligase A [Geoalkalibacter ferrihydriticus]